MLNERELSELCHQHKLGADAIAVIRRIRQSPPSRPVRSGTHNVVTYYASRKMGCVIKAEAGRTELAAIYEWDHDKSTHEFYDQPPPIKKIHDRGNGREYSHLYTPDFFCLADDFIGWVECKAEEWLIAQEAKPEPQYVRDEHGKWRCPSAERYADSLGLGFEVRSSKASDAITIQNIADLSDYCRDDCPVPTQAQRALAVGFMGLAGWCWLRDLLANDQGLSADAIFKLIADEQLHVDMQAFPMMKEPHRVRVFATRALFESRALWLTDQLESPVPAISRVTPTAGSLLLWDGRACEIMNIGQTMVSLMQDGAMRELRREDFERLVHAGAMVGTESAADSRLMLAGEQMRCASERDIEVAMQRYYCLYPERCPPGVSHRASPRTLRKWKAMARRGAAMYGNEFVGLLPQISLRGNRKRRLPDRVLELIQSVIDSHVKSKNAPGSFICWAELAAACRAEGLMVPSRKTFQTEVKRLTTPEELKKAREGEKAGYDLEIPYISLHRETPRHGTRPFEIAHVDHTMLDLQFVAEATGMPMGKAWLTVMIDAYTRKILAWVVTFDPPSYRSCMLLIRDCVRRHGRLPCVIVVDQGSEFKGEYFERLLAYLCVHKRMRPASHPRFGNVVERFFGVTNEQFTHALQGNNKALQTPRRMSHSHDPRQLAVWNLRAFREAFEGYLNEVYHAVEHPALGISPAVAMEIGIAQSGARMHTLITYDQNFRIVTMPTSDKGTAKIRPNGSFKVNKIDYFAASLLDYVGQDLPVRYDPFDVSRAYVRGRSDWLEARSNHARELAGRTEKEIEAMSIELDAIQSRTGVREKDRAAALGAFFRGVRACESSLATGVQEARERELRAADASTGLLDAPYQPDAADLLEGNGASPRLLDTAFDLTSQDSFEDF